MDNQISIGSEARHSECSQAMASQVCFDDVYSKPPVRDDGAKAAVQMKIESQAAAKAGAETPAAEKTLDAKPATNQKQTQDSLSIEQILNGLSDKPVHTRAFADSYGRVTHLALMLSPYAADDVRTNMLGAYKTLFNEMEPDTKFTIVVQNDKDKADVEKVIKDNNVPNPERINFLNPNVGDLTVWARDMMLGMYTPDDPAHTALMHQTTLHSWHANDMQVPAKISDSNPKIILDTEPFIVTDGGDVQTNTKEAFVGYYSVVSSEMKIADALSKDPALKQRVFDFYKQHFGKEVVESDPKDLHFPYKKQPKTDPDDGSFDLVRDPAFQRRELGATKVTEQKALEDLTVLLMSDRLDKPVTVMGRDDPKFPGREFDPATDHMDMGCTPIDDNTFLVGDPSMAKDIIAGMAPKEKDQVEKVLSERAGHAVKLPDSGPFQPHNRDDQSDFDAYAHVLEAKGYKVIRVPHLEPPKAGDPYLSYNNCLMERFEKDGKEIRRVFLPHYGVPKLDEAADKVWKSQGFEVHPIALQALSAEWGALRCVSNWLDRSPRG